MWAGITGATSSSSASARGSPVMHSRPSRWRSARSSVVRAARNASPVRRVAGPEPGSTRPAATAQRIRGTASSPARGRRVAIKHGPERVCARNEQALQLIALGELEGCEGEPGVRLLEHCLAIDPAIVSPRSRSRASEPHRQRSRSRTLPVRRARQEATCCQCSRQWLTPSEIANPASVRVPAMASGGQRSGLSSR